jgi:hypothetical protein
MGGAVVSTCEECSREDEERRGQDKGVESASAHGLQRRARFVDFDSLALFRMGHELTQDLVGVCSDMQVTPSSLPSSSRGTSDYIT